MIKSLVSLAFVVCIAALFSSQAFAQEDTPAPNRPIRHNYSITFSPFHLAYPELFGSYEQNLRSNISVGFVGGVGEYEQFSVMEAGVKWSYYLLGSFEHGMPITIETGYAYLRAEEDELAEDVSGSGSGMYIGPTIGYKYIADYGLTVNLAAGVQYIGVSARASDSSTGRTISKSGDDIGPLVRLLVGWSF
jgi:hypothetical protein